MNRLNEQDTQTLANLLCKKLVLDLDAGDRSNIKMYSEILNDVSREAFLFASRKYISLDLIVKYNLDEDCFFGPIMSKANGQL